MKSFVSWKGKQGKHVLYGCSELFNASQFLKQVMPQLFLKNLD